MAEKSKLHLWALSWASKGVPVFPCREGQKEPATENGFKDATTDTDQIDRWWTQNPEFNVAASPHSAGCVVLDVDAPEAIEVVEMIHGKLPATCIVQTPRGGYHYWFKGSGKNSTGKLAEHVDTRGEGGYVLLPPSQVNGVHYKFIDKSPIVPMPETMLALIQAKSDAKGIKASEHMTDLPAAIQRGREMARMWKFAEWGTIDDTTYLNAAKLADIGLSKEAIHEIICTEWYDRTGTEGNRDRLWTVAESATVNRENTEGVWAVSDPQVTYEWFKNYVSKRPQKPRPPSRFALLDEEQQDKLPDPEWLIDKVLPAKNTAILVAASKAWKTFLAIDWGMSIASGCDKWGKVISPGPVVYIAAEGATGLAKSRRPAWRLLNGVKEKVPFYVIPEMPNFSSPEDIDELCHGIKDKTGGKISLLVVDTMARSMIGQDENSAKDVSEWYAVIDMLKRILDCTVLVLHHTGKDQEKGARGSSNIIASFDNGFEMLTDKDAGITQVYAKFYRDADIPEYPWKLKAQKVLGSLAFTFAKDEDVPAKDKLSIGNIGETLRYVGAIGEDSAIRRGLLVSELARMKAWEVRKTGAVFNVMLKSGKLNGFKAQAADSFCLPEPVEGDEGEIRL